MKIRTVMLLLLISSSLCAQTRDTLEVNLNLDKCKKQYDAGTTFLGFGAAAFGLATALYRSPDKGGVNEKSNDIKLANTIYGIATVLLTTGVVIHIDSHRFLTKH
jgi:hypothetical protein